jgi:sugar lactone lactonase YvrE
MMQCFNIDTRLTNNNAKAMNLGKSSVFVTKDLLTNKFPLASITMVFAALLGVSLPALGQSDQTYGFVGFAGFAGSPGSLDGEGSAARFNFPAGVALDISSNLVVADFGNHTVRMVSSAGAVTTLVGTAGISGTNNGTGGAARFNHPFGVALDRSGNIFVADSDNHTIRKVTPAGVVTTLAGSAGTSGTNDGVGLAALFSHPFGLAVDGANNIFVADSDNHTIRKITPAGVVTTFAGSPGMPGAIDAAGGDARFNHPSGVAVDSQGNVMVADKGNFTIRRVTTNGVVTTLAGLAGYYGRMDGTRSVARFYDPSGVSVDAAGNVFVSEFGNTIRKVTPAGTVSSLTDGAGPLDAPQAVAVDAAGVLFIADSLNNRIVKGRLGGFGGISPSLRVALSGGRANVSLSWPPSHLGWELQMTTNLSGGGLTTAWTRVVGSTGGTNFSLPNNPANPGFYRLKSP